MTYSKKIVFDEKPPKAEDFKDHENHWEALDQFIDNVPKDQPISEEVYEACIKHHGLGHIADHNFNICDKEYTASVHVVPDDLPPDHTNIRIFIVAHKR